MRTYSKKVIILVGLLTISVLLSSCSKNGKTNINDNGNINVVTTTTILGDAVSIIGGNKVNLEVLMGPGIDPHLYKASAGDVSKMQKADLIIYNGLHLEGKMSDIFKKLGNPEKGGVITYAAADNVKNENLIESADFDGSYDPHIWFDVKIWIDVVEGIKQELIVSSPENQELFTSNAKLFIEELEELNRYIISRVDELDKDKRVLITAHDAFSYFGQAYTFEVKGLQGLSTISEAGTSDVRSLADYIFDHKIPAIFIESSIPAKNMEALKNAVLSRGFKVEIGGELFSDSLGDADTEEGTYIGMVKYNVDTIIDALLNK